MNSHNLFARLINLFSKCFSLFKGKSFTSYKKSIIPRNSLLKAASSVSIISTFSLNLSIRSSTLSSMEYQSDEDRDFIVDDGYKHDEDPTYVPEKEESSDDDIYVATGKDFKKLTKNSVPYLLIIQSERITNM